jgi:hypothetical protein
VLALVKDDELGSLQLVANRNKQNKKHQLNQIQRLNQQHQLLSTGSYHENKTKSDELKSNDADIIYKYQNNEVPISSRRPVIRVPFEAYITITQEDPHVSQRESSRFKIYNKKDKQSDDSHHEASTSNLEDVLPYSLKQNKDNMTLLAIGNPGTNELYILLLFYF